MPFGSIPASEIPASYSIDIDVLGQPDDATCGPTSLHSVYRYYDEDISLEQVIREVHTFEDGGTLAVWLGSHALSRGFEAVLFTCNLQLLDPSWFTTSEVNLIQKLEEQMKHKPDPKLIRTSHAFIDFIKNGGKVKLEDVTRDVLRKYLSQGYPILTGLSSTFLYRAPREVPPVQFPDDICGIPTGHFVILCGYNRANKSITVADPLTQNPFSASRKYDVHIDRVICSILLGVLTYDANFLIIKPKIPKKR